MADQIATQVSKHLKNSSKTSKRAFEKVKAKKEINHLKNDDNEEDRHYIQRAPDK
ncbi:hypothetical protein D9M72_610910 [compost metagenome]